jgi:hypothetical protein
LLLTLNHAALTEAFLSWEHVAFLKLSPIPPAEYRAHVTDANGQPLAYVYFKDEPQRQLSMKRLSRDAAFLIAVNIAKLLGGPRQILKDISRPPNSASRDD